MSVLPAAIEPTDTATALACIGDVIVALDDRRRELAAAGEHRALLDGLASVRTLVASLKVLERDIEADAAKLLAELPRDGRARRWTMDGLGVVEISNRYPTRKWHDADIIPALVRQALDPDGTGELPSPLEAANRVANALASCASLEWRVGDPERGKPGLKSFGLEPNDFRDEAGDARPVITIV
jgi:hypothetical protein